MIDRNYIINLSFRDTDINTDTYLNVIRSSSTWLDHMRGVGLSCFLNPTHIRMLPYLLNAWLQECYLRGPKDYTGKSIEPKVFCGWRTKDPPREGVLQRTAELFQSMSIEQLLEERGIPEGDHTQIRSYLPLEAFDDMDYALFTAQEWVEKGKKEGDGP